MTSWNYRVMRHVDRISDNDEIFYAIHEVHYKEDGSVRRWTQDPCGSPCGETFEEMISDLGWILAGLTKPILDYTTGKEIEPASLLADDIGKMLRDAAAGRTALSQATAAEDGPDAS